jgi:hypothetical protein
VEVNGLKFEGIFLKSLNEKVQRDTILIPRPQGLLGQLAKEREVGEIIKHFNHWSQKCQRTWGFGKTGTLKKIERLAIEKNIPAEFKLRTVAHHYGAVPVLQIGEIRRNNKQIFVAILPSLADLRIRDYVGDKREILLSFERYLPLLFAAYYEQVGFYLRAIFFGADERHIIKYAHRIRSILVGSIRGKVEEIKNGQADKNRLLANSLRRTYERDIQIAEAVDAYGHLITNYIYSFFCMESNISKYEKRLAEIVHTDGVLSAENPISFLRECVRHISEPKSNDLFVSNVGNLKTDWLVHFGEAAAFIGEINRSCPKGPFAPTIFVGYHFDIEANDHAFEQLQLAVKEHWPHVQLLRGRHLARNIRWSLLGRIWITDTYLFLIPPTFITRNGTKKPLNPKEDWLLLEFVYSVLLGKHCLTMKPRIFNPDVFEEFKIHLNNYAPEQQEIPQVRKLHWDANLAKAKRDWIQVLRDHERLPSMNALEVSSLASFEEAILSPLHKRLIELFFQAAYWYLEPGALLILQSLLKQFPAGNGTIERKELREQFKSLNSKHKFAEGLNTILSFNFNLFHKLEPLVVQNDDGLVTLRLANVVEVLCNSFCCHPPRFIEHIVGQMLSTREGDR